MKARYTLEMDPAGIPSIKSYLAELAARPNIPFQGKASLLCLVNVSAAYIKCPYHHVMHGCILPVSYYSRLGACDALFALQMLLTMHDV